MTCQPVPSLSAKGSITGCSFSASAMGPTMPASAEAARANPCCLVGLNGYPDQAKKIADPQKPHGTKVPFPHCEYVKVHTGYGECRLAKLPPLTGCMRPIAPSS